MYIFMLYKNKIMVTSLYNGIYKYNIHILIYFDFDCIFP